MWRNVGVMLFIFALPVMQVILFCLAIGRDPTGLNLAIVNHEMNNTVSFDRSFICFLRTLFISKIIFFFALKDICYWEDGCHFSNLGCRYLNHLNHSVIKTFYTDLEEAKEAVRLGNAWGAIYITENFTDAFTARAALGINIYLP